MTSKKEFETKLILEVKNHMCLYAKDDQKYSDKMARINAWGDISLVLGRPVEECQSKWTTLRNSFRSYFRAENSVPSGSGATTPVRWIHFESLKFLIPYVRIPDDDCGNYSQKQHNSSNLEVIDVGTEPHIRKNKAQKRHIEEPLDRVLKAIENKEVRSPMELFMENVALQVSDFSPQRIVRFQSRILSILGEEMAEHLAGAQT
ncbi:uncharacterized protein LOC129948330 [Eupeodes corollae]|uniref:uncharacterized protein LOC129948330 n=1 Tax=Eupeodes corollae TaxID=290404 RepID=UPI0024922FB4|nr:uncharacterized protein LOC129948330 [Eupeodes corollae]